VAWAPDHAFGDELIAGRAERRDLPAQLLGNVTGAVRTRTKLGHGAQIAFFHRRQAVEANAEKTFVQGHDGRLRGDFHITQRDR